MTSPTTVEVLTQARALLEKGWTQKAYARTGRGELISFYSSIASCFCIRGAVMRAELNSGGPDFISDANSTLFEILRTSVPDWNDAPGRTQSEVLALMDRAIDLAREKEAGNV